MFIQQTPSGISQPREKNSRIESNYAKKRKERKQKWRQRSQRHKIIISRETNRFIQLVARIFTFGELPFTFSSFASQPSQLHDFA